MPEQPKTANVVSAIGFVRANDRDVRTGLVGYVTCVISDTLQLDGITLRVTADRRPTLSFPTRTDARGRKHPYVRPIDDDARQAIEAAVFDALGIDPEVGL
mgnify:CR=1 FL=1|tara:strand:+ start:179 stop:481 length:303 start_codon:yes stop_codon:yes gene_type:complete